MTKKISRLIAMVLVVAMALTGCMTQTLTTKINSDGSATVTMVADVEKKVLDEMAKASGSTSDAMFEGQKYRIVTKDGKEYYEVSDTKTATAAKLSQMISEQFGTDIYVSKDTLYGEVDLNQNEQIDTIAFYKAMGVDVSGIKINVTFELASAVTASTGTIDTTNPNKVTFTYDLSSKKSVMFATTDKNVTVDTAKATVNKLNAVSATKIKKLKVNKTKATAKKASVTLKIKKVRGASAYQIQYSTSKKFKSKKSKTFKQTTLVIKNLKKGKKYFVRVRASKYNYAGTTVYSKWVTKTLKVKK